MCVFMVTMVQPVKMEICVHQIRARTEEHVPMAMVGITVLVEKAGQDLTANRNLRSLQIISQILIILSNS